MDGVHGAVDRGGEKEEVGILGMNGRGGQRIVTVAHIQEGQRFFTGNAQENVQIPQTYIAINAQNPLSGFCQYGGNTGAEGCFTRAAFAGNKTDDFAQKLTHLPH